MLSRFFPKPFPFALFLLAAVASPAHAQLNTAYDNGYRPMLDLASKLKEIVDSADKRADYSAVKDTGTAYKDRLDKVIAGLENAGRNMRDSSNTSWVRSSCSPALSAAKAAKSKAEKLYEKGDNKQDSKGEALSLQESLATLSDEFKKCWRDHEDRRQRLMDEFNTTREKWWNATKDDRRPVDDLGRRATEAREKFNDLQSRANEAAKLYMSAQDQADKARSELFAADAAKTIDDVKSRYAAWAKAEDLVKRVAEASTSAAKSAADASRGYTDAQATWERAMQEYTKQAAEGDDLYKLVLERHQKAYELAQEYKPFSM